MDERRRRGCGCSRVRGARIASGDGAVTAELARGLLADSVTTLDARHADTVVVTGSHGGLIAARYAAGANVRVVIFNDGGVGLDRAGIAGLALLDTIGLAAVAVAYTSARIADARDTFEHGAVSHVNATARALDVAIGMRCAHAVARLRGARRALAPCDAQSMWRTGVLSRANDATCERGWRESMSVRDAASKIVS